MINSINHQIKCLLICDAIICGIKPWIGLNWTPNTHCYWQFQSMLCIVVCTVVRFVHCHPRPHWPFCCDGSVLLCSLPPGHLLIECVKVTLVTCYKRPALCKVARNKARNLSFIWFFCSTHLLASIQIKGLMRCMHNMQYHHILSNLKTLAA